MLKHHYLSHSNTIFLSMLNKHYFVEFFKSFRLKNRSGRCCTMPGRAEEQSGPRQTENPRDINWLSGLQTEDFPASTGMSSGVRIGSHHCQEAGGNAAFAAFYVAGVFQAFDGFEECSGAEGAGRVWKI